jgi:hypothetical protein
MVTLKNGDTLRLRCQFQHKGAAFTSGRLYGAIGKRAVIGGFDEKLVSYITVSGIKDDVAWTTYTITLDIPIKNIGTIGLPAGSDYEVYVKFDRIPGPDLIWYGPENDITLEAPLEEAEFQDLTVSYAKA